jgi:2,3-bisphosphoglycerate-independent phosphoglycerate mutase
LGLQVTFFWNGNRSGYFKEELETYVEIPSDAVPFNEAPDMKAREITEAGKEALLSGKYQMVRINFANPGQSRHRPLSILALVQILTPLATRPHTT